MLVKINDAYRGTYGHFNPELNTVTPKRAGDPPFEVPNGVAERHLRNGVLVAVTGTAKAEPGAVTAPEPEEAEEEKGVDEMTFAELKKAAKDRGINCFGKKADAIRELIREYDAVKAPSFTAEDPV